MYVTGPRYEYKLFNQSRAKLWGWINLNNLTVLHSYHLKVIRDTSSRGLSIKLSSRSTNTKNNSLCGWHKKRKGRGRGGGGEREGRGTERKERNPSPFFSSFKSPTPFDGGYTGYKYIGTSIKRRAKGLIKYVRCNEVSLYRAAFPNILLLPGLGISFVIPRSLFYRGL